MFRGAKGGATLLVIGLLLSACQTTPSPSASAGPSTAPFTGMTYPADAPADCAYGGEIAQIKAVDRLTVEFTLCRADPAFLSKIARANNEIQDSDWLAKYGGNQSIQAKANGTGPYMVSAGLPGTGAQITLGRFDGYWGTKAKTATVLVKWNADPAARTDAVQTGTADGADNPSSLAPIATIQPALRLPREELSTLYIGMSNTYQPFDSQKIRQALAMGIDRQQIVTDLMPQSSGPADYFTPCAIEFGCVGDRWYGHDVAAANALLAKPPFPGALFTHIYYSDTAACGLPDPSLVAQELKTQLTTTLGFNADLQPLAAATFAKNMAAGLLDGLYVMEWCPDTADPSGFLDGPFSRTSPQLGTLDPSITTALLAGDRTGDPTARKAAYEAANNAIRDQVPVIPIAHGTSATAWKSDVTGAVSSPVDDEQFAAIDPGGRALLTWMQAASPSTFYCANASDGDSQRVCQNVFESLYGFKPGTAQATPDLAESCAPNQQLTVWTCHLRSGVTFHDGSSLDANDVVASFAAQWDYKQPMHAGRTAPFAAWVTEFGPFLNAPTVVP